MSAAIVICAVWLGGIAIVGALLVARAPSLHVRGPWQPLRRRITMAVDAWIPLLGRPFTAAFVVLAGGAVTLGCGWLLGIVAHALQNSVDWPTFHWSQRHQIRGDWSHAWRHITNMGAPRVTQALALAGAIVLGISWRLRGRRWWVPVLALFIGYAMEKYGQIILQTVVHRGHPPTTHGTFPSGGCARVLVVYGLIIFLFLRLRRPESRRPWVAGAVLTAFFVSVQAYARLYNLEHWITDVVGGIVWGTMLLLLMIGGFLVLDREVAVEVAGRHLDSGIRDESRAVRDRATPEVPA